MTVLNGLKPSTPSAVGNDDRVLRNKFFVCNSQGAGTLSTAKCPIPGLIVHQMWEGCLRLESTRTSRANISVQLIGGKYLLGIETDRDSPNHIQPYTALTEKKSNSTFCVFVLIQFCVKY